MESWSLMNVGVVLKVIWAAEMLPLECSALLLSAQTSKSAIHEGLHLESPGRCSRCLIFHWISPEIGEGVRMLNSGMSVLLTRWSE